VGPDETVVPIPHLPFVEANPLLPPVNNRGVAQNQIIGALLGVRTGGIHGGFVCLLELNHPRDIKSGARIVDD
jgi:hypothetical protein